MTVISRFALGSETANAQTNDMLSVTIRVHDYAGIPTTCMASAQEHVKKLYADIGVQTIWAETHHPEKSLVRESYDSRELLINIVTPAMSRRMGVTEQTVGLAAVTLRNGGKIAYLLFDRVRHVALASGGQASDVLGMVIAHEIGHLLLPYGSHSPSGVMRPIWRPEDFSLSVQLQPAFTPAQADGIRRLLRVWASDPPSRSQTAGEGSRVRTGSGRRFVDEGLQNPHQRPPIGQ